jgi:lipopolysaccharide export system protein LptA
MEFRAAEDMGYLESAAFDGKAEVVLSRMESGKAGSGEISADRIEVSFLPEAGGPSSIGSRGSARMTLRPETGARTAVRAAEIGLKFGEGGELDRWSASGGSLTELSGVAAEKLVFEGDSFMFEASSGVLRVSGGPARPAAAESPRARVEAASIAAGPAEGDLDAAGGVKCLLKRRGEDRGDGFFSGDEPVYVSSASLSVRAASRAYSFAGDVQAWQGKEFLLAGELDYREETGEMKGRGGTAAGMTQPAAEGPGRRIEIGGGAMTYSPAGRAIVFKERAYVQWPGARLEAGSVSAVLAPGGEGAESLTARTGVVLSKGRYEGRGDAAVYSAGTDRIALTGNPVLIDREGGSARGDKLTFGMGDGKILVENEGQGRSATVIKS